MPCSGTVEPCRSNKSGAKVVDLHILDCSKFSPGTIKVLEFFKLYRQCSGTQQDPEGKGESTARGYGGPNACELWN